MFLNYMVTFMFRPLGAPPPCASWPRWPRLTTLRDSLSPQSTNLAKVAYWLRQNGLSVMIAGCDTFRSGALEQLKTHCRRLDLPLFEKGYKKDPSEVAAEAAKVARREVRADHDL